MLKILWLCFLLHSVNKKLSYRWQTARCCFVKLLRYCKTFCQTRIVWLPDGEKISKIFWHDPRTWQTDGQTGRRTNTQTLHDSIDRACIASRGKNAWQHVIRTTIAKNRHFYVPRPKFFVCPGDAPVAITQNFAWMKRQFSACQTLRSMYSPTFNAFPVIRTASAKNRSFHVPQPTFFPLETPLQLSRNVLHGWKDNSMLVKSLAACTYLYSIVSELYDA